MKTRSKELSRTPFVTSFTCFIAIWTSLVSSHGANPTAGDLIVSVNEFTGPTYIAEYTAAGNRVQVFANVPMPGGTGITTEEARDLVYGPDNAVYVYNGTFTPSLARLDVVGGGWTQQSFDGWSTVNNQAYGGLTRVGQYLYATDMTTFGPGQTPSGIVRFDTAGGAAVRFAESIQPIDINVGPDGILYALVLGPQTIYKFDPITFASLGTVPISFADLRGMAVAGDGSILLVGYSGVIRRYSPSGALMDTLVVSNTNLSDIDIDPNGRVALGTLNGCAVVTDLDLDSYTRFFVTDLNRSGNVFVTWAAIPEPTTVSLAWAGLLVVIVGSVSKCRPDRTGR